MRVLLRDADDGALRVLECSEAFVYSRMGQESLNLVTSAFGTPDIVFPLCKGSSGELFLKHESPITGMLANTVIKCLYRDGQVDLSSYVWDIDDEDDEDDEDDD